jgi:bacillithiol system protein YtxJ
MNWTSITTLAQLDVISERSYSTPVLIFKHSTRCQISSMVLNRLEREEAPEGVDLYFLDLIANRLISNAIAEKYSVAHESPQVLLIKNGECFYDESHNAITMQEIKGQM